MARIKAEHFRHIAIALLDDALKFSPPGAPVEITRTGWGACYALRIRAGLRYDAGAGRRRRLVLASPTATFRITARRVCDWPS